MIHSSHKNLGFLLTRSASRWNELLMKELEDLEHEKMKPSHGAVLIPLFDLGELSITEIRSYSKLKKQTMTTYIRELIDLGLITREPYDGDKRKSLIRLTKKGVKLKSSSNIAVKNVNKKFSKIISTKELEVLREVLTKILKSLD